MAAKTSERRKAASAIAGTQRHHGAADPRLPDLRRDLRAAELEEHIKRIVDQAPPLSEEQRARLVQLLRPAAGSDASTAPPRKEAA